jgi:hypothetical protein
MWFLYLLADTWLEGCLLLPSMLFVRWLVAKWRAQAWLTHSRKHWCLFWGCFELVKTFALREPNYFAEFPYFGYLGWANMATWHLTRSYPLWVRFQIALSLKAIAESAIACGLAATAWWAYRLFIQGTARRHRTVVVETYGIGLLLSICMIGIANDIERWRPPTCADCFQPHGVPFTFFHEGGFGGGEGFVWKGIVGDSIVILVLGMIIGLIWTRLAERRSRLRVSPL